MGGAPQSEQIRPAVIFPRNDATSEDIAVDSDLYIVEAFREPRARRCHRSPRHVGDTDAVAGAPSQAHLVIGRNEYRDLRPAGTMDCERPVSPRTAQRRRPETLGSSHFESAGLVRSMSVQGRGDIPNGR